MYRIDVMTLFPETVGNVLGESILGRAQERGAITVQCHQIRDYTQNKQNQVDDYPYGGGRGAILQADPLFRCLEHIKKEGGGSRPHVIFLSPCGKTFTQKEAVRLAREHDHLVLVCGHYEGVDQRFIDACVDEELSLGDFVLTGGEIAAMAVADAVCRLVPGVLADPSCYEEESHWNGLLEYPQYSRPAVWEGHAVPAELLTGNHQEVAAWRRKEQLRRTRDRRPDLFARFTPQTPEDQAALRALEREDKLAALTGGFAFRKGELDDLPALVAITDLAKVTLRQRRVDQWQDGYPQEAVLRRDIEREECWVLTYEGRVAGLLVLSLEEEPCYAGLTDGYWGSDEPYAVLHRCALDKPFRGLGLGDRLVAQGEALARAAGRRWLRVDTHKKNRPMQGLLRRNGFVYRGNVTVTVGEGHDPRRLAFEKAL